MAFLTMIAPLVGLTYPIDKIGGGASQSFNLWFKEYTFNLLIQPIDLLLYTIIISTTMNVVEINFIFAIVAIGFLLQAEKFIKKMFGLGAEGGAGKGNFATGAAFGSIMSAMQTGSQAVTGAISSAGEDESERQKNTKIRKADSNAPKNFDTFKDDYEEPNKEEKGKGKVKIPFLGNMFNGNEKEKGEENKKRFFNSNNNTGKNPKELKLMSREEAARRAKIQERKINRKIRRAKIREGTKNVGRRFINGKNGQRVAKLAAMSAGAAAMGMLGVTAGLAADDYDDILKLGLAGVAGGAVLGKEAVKQGKTTIKGVKNVGESTLKGLYGEKYDEKILNPLLDKQWYHSGETKERFRTKYGDNWKEKREEALELRKLGITDQSEIEKAIKLKDKNPGLTIQQAGSVINYVNKSTSREAFMREGGEEAEYNHILNLVGGDKKAADKAMKAVKEALHIGSSKTKEGNEDKQEDS